MHGYGKDGEQYILLESSSGASSLAMLCVLISPLSTRYEASRMVHPISWRRSRHRKRETSSCPIDVDGMSLGIDFGHNRVSRRKISHIICMTIPTI
jgi:hypothetical protein